jgi:AcrR family transcriptional regulator
MSRPKTAAVPSKATYHHGDLRRRLVEEAIAMIRQDSGIESLSLRKLAERVGVSPTALYHHFSDKQALFCAVAEEGIRLFLAQLLDGLKDEASLEGRFERFVSIYVRLALDNPELYDLLFGRTMWKGEGQASEEFRRQARAAFRRYAKTITGLQTEGVFSADLNPLRLAQVMWSTLHGVCCMHNDGLAFTAEDVEDISQYARKLLQQLRTTYKEADRA